MGKQLQFYLTEEQAGRLYEISSKQCRRPHEQARYLVLSALGLVNNETDRQTPVNKNGATTSPGNCDTVSK